MKIMIESPGGPRPGAEPSGGINDTTSLVKALLITLAAERARGHAQVVLDIDLENLRPELLVEIARSVSTTRRGLDHAG